MITPEFWRRHAAMSNVSFLATNIATASLYCEYLPENRP
jgi:hypothetical protein